MKLQAIALENFKKHADLTINFSDTLTVIRGPNWAGKSSILHGIFFVLFGSKAVPCAKERIPTRGHKNTKGTLWFEWDGKDCVIERTLTTCTLYVDGELKATGASTVTEYVQQTILGLSLTEAITLAYSPQSETASLLTLGVPALNRMIESLSQADLIETLITRAAKIVASAESGLNAVGETLDEVEPQEQIDAWTEVARIAGEEFDAITTQMTEIQTQLKAVENDHRDKASRNEKLLFARSDREQLNRIKTSLSEIDEQIQKLDSGDIAQLQSRLADLQSHYTKLYQEQVEIQQAKSNLAKLDQWFDTTGKDWQEKEANVPLLEAAKKELSNLNAPITEAATLKATTYKVMEEKTAERQSGVCSKCDRPFDKHDPKAAEKAERDAEITYHAALEAYALLDQTRQGVLTEIARLEKLQPPAGYEDSYKAKVAEYESLQKFLSEFADPTVLAETLAAAKQAVEIQQAAVATAQAAERQAKDLRMRRQTQDMQRQTLEKTLAGYPTGEPEDLAPLVSKIDTLRKASHDNISVRSQAQQKLSDARSSIHSWQVLLQQAKDRNTKRKDLEIRAERYGAMVKWLRASKSAFLGKIWDGLTLIASEIISNATMGYASSLHRTDEGEFVVIEDGVDVPMVSASGGMRSICGVALRMALDHVLAQSVGFVVLDEPSSELSDEHAASLAGALRACQRQVVLVTHREGEEFVSDTVISL